MLRTGFFYLVYYPWTLIVLLLAMPISLFGENAVHNLGILWGRSALLLAGIRFKVLGTEHIPHGRPAIYISNHQSNFDIPLFYAALPLQFRWMAKQELFDIPLFGLAMKRSGYIPIDRSDRRKAMHGMLEAAKRIAAGASVVIFPEGTRTPDGELKSFKKGGFLLAIKAQVPVVPVAIKGSFEVMAKDSWRIHGGEIVMQILPPAETSGLKNADTDSLLEQVHTAIAAQLQRGVQ